MTPLLEQRPYLDAAGLQAAKCKHVMDLRPETALTKLAADCWRALL